MSGQIRMGRFVAGLVRDGEAKVADKVLAVIDLDEGDVGDRRPFGQRGPDRRLLVEKSEYPDVSPSP